MQKIKLLLVDDDAITRDGLKAALAAEDGFIVTEAYSGYMALQCHKRSRPDVVLLDLRMPGMDGIETLLEMSKLDEPAPVVILTAFGDIDSAVEAMKSGACDYIVKPPKPDRLIEALRRAAESGREKATAPDCRCADSAALVSYKSLTDRERKIFKMIVAGQNTVQIARSLSISPRTVETHLGNVMKKFTVHSRADLAQQAKSLGILK